MSFYIYDITFLILFSLAVGIFLYKRRSNLKREGIMYLYRTKVGIKFIEYVGTRYKKTLSVLGLISVITGYFLMISMIYFLYRIVYIYLFVPEIVRAIKIPPLMPLIPYLPSAFKIDFLPPFYFTYWIIAIAVIAIFHEFAHGIFARKYGVKIHSTGFGFLGPFLAAFVEPDEKQMEKKPKYQQLVILSAGVFTNLILAIIFFLLLSVFFLYAYVPAGSIFNAYTPGVVQLSTITIIGGQTLIEPSKEEIINLIGKENIKDNFILGSNGNSIELTQIKTSDGKTYYTTIEKLRLQLELKDNNNEVALYEDFPAINAGLRGAIIGINYIEIKEHTDLIQVMENFNPGETIKITTKDIDEDGMEQILEYDITLASNEEGKGIIGIAYFSKVEGTSLGRITEFFNFFKKAATNYEPRFNQDLVLFIYNLIWWLALINLSVALINMWPVAIFDGGRFFYLTVWGITGSEKLGKAAFTFMTYLILGSLFVLMLGWFVAIF